MRLRVQILFFSCQLCSRLACSPVGAGKSLTFLVPIVQRIFELKVGRDQAPNRNAPYAVIAAPTHELAQQIYIDTERLIETIFSVKGKRASLQPKLSR